LVSDSASTEVDVASQFWKFTKPIPPIFPRGLTPQAGPEQGPKDSTRTYPETLAENFPETLSNLDRKKRRVGSLNRLPHLTKFSNPTRFLVGTVAGCTTKSTTIEEQNF